MVPTCRVYTGAGNGLLRRRIAPASLILESVPVGALSGFVLVLRALAFLHEDIADHQRWRMVRRHALIAQHDVAVDGLFCVAATGATDDDTDTRQSDRVRAHDARLDARVQRAAGQIAGTSPGERRAQRLDFRVSRRVMASTHGFDAFGYELVTVNNQRADGSVAIPNCLARQLDAATHVPFML